MKPRVVTAKEMRERILAMGDDGGSFAGQQPIGFWTPTEDTPPARGRVWPGTMVDLTWTGPEREKVIAYLKEPHGWKIGYMGCSYCRLCKEKYGTQPVPPESRKLADWEVLGSKDFGDGTYVWPEGFVHYVEVHGVKPPQAFIDHVLSGGSQCR